MEWTERCESWFVKHLAKIRKGQATPQSVGGWISSIRGLDLARKLIDNNKSLAETFVDEFVPLL
jgi:hypothetical protein